MFHLRRLVRAYVYLILSSYVNVYAVAVIVFLWFVLLSTMLITVDVCSTLLSYFLSNVELRIDAYKCGACVLFYQPNSRFYILSFLVNGNRIICCVTRV